MRKFLPILALSLFSTALVLADQSVYSTKLGDGWSNWSWAKVTLAGKTISVDSKAWQGLYFHHDNLDAAAVGAISFKVSGGAKGGQKLQVMATVKGKGVREVYLPPLAAGKWTQITATAKQLGLTNQKVDGFWVQAQTPCTYQVQDVKVVSKK